MSTTAEDLSAAPIDGKLPETSLDGTDEIAMLLIEEDESASDDNTGDESQTQGSTQDDDEESSDEQAATDDGKEETTLEAVADDDVTWESTLGVSEGDLSFDDDGNIVGFNTKVNGEQQTVDAKTLIAGYQNNKSFTEKAQAHSEAVKAFEVQKGNIEQVYSARLKSVDALSAHFEKQLVSEFDGVNWDQLRKDNPAEYAAMRHDFSVKAGELQKIKDAIESDKGTLNQELSLERQTKTQAYMKGQFDQMIEKNPEWADEKLLTKARDSFKEFALDTYGFKHEEFDSVFDARLIELVKDAKKYHDGSRVAEKKLTKPVPKFQKSRGKRKPQATRLDKLTKAAKTATGDNKRNLQAGAVAELLLGG